MLDEHYWNRRWEESRIGFHQDEINPYLTEFWPAMKVAENAHVLVPLCGKSRDMCWLAERGHRMTGVEFCPLAVKEYFALRGESPSVSKGETHTSFSSQSLIEVQVGDFLSFQSDEPYDVFYDRAALVAIEPESRSQYVENLTGLMKPQSCGLLVSLEISDESHQGPPFSVNRSQIEALFDSHWQIEVLKKVRLSDEKMEVCYQLSRK